MARKETERLNPSGVRLRRTFEQRALKRMISQLDEPDASTELLCKMLHVYCELIRQDAAAEKARSTGTPATSNASATSPGTATDSIPRDRPAFEAALRDTVRDVYGIRIESELPAKRPGASA